MASSRWPSRQLPALAGRPSGRPPMPVRAAGQREVIAVRHSTFDIDTASAHSRPLRTPQGIRASLGCSSPKPRRLGLGGAFGAPIQKSKQNHDAGNTAFNVAPVLRCQRAPAAALAARGRRFFLAAGNVQSNFRSPAAVLPRSVFSSKETFCPSVSVIIPASLTAVIWTNTSLPPSSG